MKVDHSARVGIGKRITDELLEFAIVAAYLFVCFAAILYLEASILKAQGVEFAPFGYAAVKALICAKFVSVGHVLRVGERFKTLPLIWPTLYRSVAFLLFLLFLNGIEEVVVGMMHGRDIVDSLANLAGGTLDQLLATSFVGLLILIPFFAFRVLGESVGEQNLVRVFFRTPSQRR